MKKITLLAAAFAVFSMNAQDIIFEDDFEAESVDATTYAKWTASDEDEDGNNWEVFDADAVQYDSDNDMTPDTDFDWIMTGLGVDSDSWEANVPFTPNNFLTTTDPIDLSNSTNTTLTYKVGSYQTGGSFIDDQYSIYLTATNDVDDITAATPIVTKTVADDASCVAEDGSDSAAEVTVDLSAFDGETVYLTFRHYDTFDQNSVLIDDVVVSGAVLGIEDNNISGFTQFLDTNANLNLRANVALTNVELFNIVGQQVVNKALSSNNETVNLSSLSAGVYIARVNVAGQTETFKIVKR